MCPSRPLSSRRAAGLVRRTLADRGLSPHAQERLSHQRQLATAKRLEAALAIDLVVAWRIFHLAKLGRETPEVPCTVFFEDDEWKALWLRVNPTPELPQNPPTLRQAMRMLASLGGFLGRKCDGEPGTQTLWLGLQRLDDFTHMYRVLTAVTGPPGVQRRFGA